MKPTPTALKVIENFQKVVKKIPGIMEVNYTIARDFVDFKILSDTRESEALYKIYQLEMALMDACPSLTFDFKIMFS